MGDYFDLTVEGMAVSTQNGKAPYAVTVRDVSRTKLIQQLLADLDSREMILESLESEELSAIFGGQIKDFIDFAGRTGMFTHEARCDLIEYAGLRAPIMRKALLDIQRVRDNILPSLGCEFHLLLSEDYERIEKLDDKIVIQVYEDQIQEYQGCRFDQATWPWCTIHQRISRVAPGYCQSCPFKKRHGECHAPNSDTTRQNKLFGHIRDVAQIMQKDKRWQGVWNIIAWPPFVEQVNRIYRETQELLGEPT